MFRNYLVRLFDTLWREPRMIFKYYLSYNGMRQSCSDRNIFMVDGKVGHGGMFDRLKGAISVFAISKVHDKPFKLYFVYPFLLTKYLESNEYDWTIDEQNITYRYPLARPLLMYGECYDPQRLFKKRHCESHFYYGYDSLNVINKRYGTAFDWGELYRELFRPTAYLQKHIDDYRQKLGERYIAVHTRFLNLLGDKMETSINPELGDEQKKLLMENVANEIRRIAANNGGVRMLLASDSMIFILYMQKMMPNVYVVPGNVRHVDTARQTSDDENLKVFVDYYLIAGAAKVFNIVAEGMWSSAFPEYSAKIGKTKFERINL